MSLGIRLLGPSDLPVVDPLLTAAYGRSEGWADEVARLLAIQPDGWFAADLDGQLVGMGGAKDYGPFAWIGLMAVAPSLQRRGIGRALLDAVLGYVWTRGCRTAVLDASNAGERLYEAFGFVDRGTTILLRQEGPGMQPLLPERVTVVQRCELPELAQFDARSFGADRSAILSSLFHDGVEHPLIWRDADGTVEGYLFMQPDRIGPWVAASRRAAEELLVAALSLASPFPLSVRAPSTNPDALPLLQRFGFVVQRSLRHMCLGPSEPVRDRTEIYSEASFAIG